MAPKTVVPSRALGYSDLYLDFLAGKSPASDFYLAHDVAAVSRQIDQSTYRRSDLVRILTRQNTEFGVDHGALQSIQRLDQPNAVCVFAGQQAGLFTGPMLVLVKALAVVKLAAVYEAQLGRPVIPVFWIAGDDHDFDEIATTWI